METAPWNIHGSLRVSENGHYLEHEDGTGFFWLGDTAWRLASLKPADVDHYLQNRLSKGFNVIQFNAIGLGKSSYSGQSPFKGSGRPWPSAELNEPYWKHVDYIVERAKQRGLYVAIFAWWGTDADRTFKDPYNHNYEYGKALGSRYKNEPHIIWVGSGEYHKPNMWKPPVPEQHILNLTRLVEGIRAGDTGNHLLTMHPLSFLSSSEEFHHEKWLDFNMIQTHVMQGYIDHLVYGDWCKTPPKPTVNSEAWYEGEEELFERRAGVLKVAQPRQRKFDSGWIQRYQAYWSVFFGGMGYTYGHMNLWMMSDLYEIYTYAKWGTQGVLMQSALDAPGSANLIHLRTLMESKPIQTRIPDPSLISLNTQGTDATLSPNLRCATRDADGSWAFVYTTRGETMRIAMSRLADGKANAFWYNPRNGQWNYEGSDHEAKQPFETGIPAGTDAPDYHFYPPGERTDGNDWVLALEVEGRL